MLADTKMHTETEKLFALDKPSLENLSYCLRHPETWPEGFIWDYSDCDNCAMGLAHKLWTSVPEAQSEDGASIMARIFAMPYEAANSTFLGNGIQHSADWVPSKVKRGWRGTKAVADFGAVTPEMVADQIDKHLASSK